MVETGTPAARAASAACDGLRPTVFVPSESSTTRAGGGSCPTSPGTERSASREVKTASPMAVLSDSCRAPIAACTEEWSWVGGTTTAATPLKDTSPTLNRSGRPWTNSTAEARAAVIRSGLTSCARMEIETSRATTTVARSRGTSTSPVGRAKAVVSATSDSSSRAAGTCLFHAAERGTSPASRSSSVKRRAYAGRRRCSST